MILDWSRVHHTDSSFSAAVAHFERQATARSIATFHAGAALQGGNVGPELRRRMPRAKFLADLDLALEAAENVIEQAFGAGAPRASTSMLEAVSLLAGMQAQGRELIEKAMTQKFFSAGHGIVAAGEPSDELMLVLHGSASIFVRTPGGKDVRLAGVRRGATIGEIGFPDRATRSATVIAHEDVTVSAPLRPEHAQTALQLTHLPIADTARYDRLRPTHRDDQGVFHA